MGASKGEVRAPMDQRRWSLQPGNLPRVHQALAQVHKRDGEARERQGAQGTPDAAFVEHDRSETQQVLEIREEMRRTRFDHSPTFSRHYSLTIHVAAAHVCKLKRWQERSAKRQGLPLVGDSGACAPRKCSAATPSL